MKTASLVCVLALFAWGCEDTTPAPRVPVAGTNVSGVDAGATEADERVVERLADATCQREQSCGTIGPGAYFGTREQCMATMRSKLLPKLNVSECPGGIDKDVVDSCITSFEASECAQPGDAITRNARCPTADLCLK